MINLPKIPQGIFGPDMPELSYGCKGPAVALLQQVLNFHMPFTPPPLVVDGIFGPKTKARTSEFQKLCEVTVDGIVGPQTARKICGYVESRFHLLVVPRRVAKKRFGAGTIGVMGLPKPPQRWPFPQSAEQVVQQAPIPQSAEQVVQQSPLPQSAERVLQHKNKRQDRNSRLMINFENHLRVGAAVSGGGNLPYNFKTRAHEPTAFLATDLTVAVGLGWKEKFAAEIGGGFLHEMSFGLVDEQEWFAIAYSKLVLKLKETEHFEFPFEVQARAAFPITENERPTFSAAACLGPKIKFGRRGFEAALGFNICLNYSVTREEGGDWLHMIGPIYGVTTEIRYGPPRRR
jgi:hypothetical protein